MGGGTNAMYVYIVGMDTQPQNKYNIQFTYIKVYIILIAIYFGWFCPTFRSFRKLAIIAISTKPPFPNELDATELYFYSSLY